jgi:hypothetical protein
MFDMYDHIEYKVYIITEIHNFNMDIRYSIINELIYKLKK